MNEQMFAGYYADLCQTLLAIRKSRDWDGHYETFEEYAKARWGLSKARAKQLCAFADFRAQVGKALWQTLPETPDLVAPILSLPRKEWVSTWELVLTTCKPPFSLATVEGVMERFGLFKHKKKPPSVLKAIRVRKAAKTIAELEDGSALVAEIGGRALGKNWEKAVEVVIDADQARHEQRKAV